MTSPDYAHLLQRLHDSVLSEAEAERLRLKRQWSLPLGERVARGLALEGLRVRALRSNGILTLTCSHNESRFREGDTIVLHRGDPHGLDSVRGVLEWDDETELEVWIQNGNPHFLKAEPGGWIADAASLDLTSYYLDALDRTAGELRGRTAILPLLTGYLTPRIDFASYERARQAALEAGLDSSQAEAAAQAYATDLAHLIQGPPGTGKTLVLAYLVQMWVADGRRVLVTALTHRAIHNALNKIARIAPGLPVCKVGSGSRTEDLQVPNYEDFYSSGFADLTGGYAVGATPFATSTSRLANVEFDVVVFDEASQITLPLALMGMLAGSKWVFIGDERQLPPVTSHPTGHLGSTSIFGYLSGRGWESALSITYRLNDALASWPSRTFYEGTLHPASQIAGRRLHLQNAPPARWAYVLDPQRPAVFIDLGHTNTTVRSRREAEVAAELVLALLEAGVPPWEIGIVVPYRAQGRAIRNLLRGLLPDTELRRELVVDTVERMQGQEREVVIVSLTTSSAAFASQLAEFFFRPERLNVAVTRPRNKLVILGSSHVLQAAPQEPELEAWVDLLRDLLDHCTCCGLPEADSAGSNAHPGGLPAPLNPKENSI